MEREICLFVALFATACVPYQTIELELYSANGPKQATFDTLSEKELEAVLGSEELTGYSLVPVQRAPLELELVEVAPKTQFRGRYWRNGLCDHHIRATPQDFIVAHEIGHFLGLGHVKDPGNIMRLGGADENGIFTDKQRDTMRKTAKQIERWCWDSSEPEKRAAVLEPVTVVCELE